MFDGSEVIMGRTMMPKLVETVSGGVLRVYPANENFDQSSCPVMQVRWQETQFPETRRTLLGFCFVSAAFLGVYVSDHGPTV